MAKRKKPHRGDPQPGTELELLIERVARLLHGTEARITRNDHIVDRDTGDMREVDVSVRVEAGDVSILLIFECRDRSRVQDVRWIEELAGKARSVGAARAIAVSSRGFSRGAVTKARAFNVELRTLDKLSLADFEAWAPMKLQFTRTVLRIVNSFLRLDATGGPLDSLSLPQDEKAFSADGANLYSIEEIIHEFQAEFVPVDATDVVQKQQLLVIKDGLWLYRGEQRWRVAELRIVVEVEQTLVAPIPVQDVTSYGAPEGDAHAAMAKLDVTAAARELGGAQLIVTRDGRFKLVADYAGKEVQVMAGQFSRNPP